MNSFFLIIPLILWWNYYYVHKRDSTELFTDCRIRKTKSLFFYEKNHRYLL